MKDYEIIPLELKVAKEFVNEHHRHNSAPHRDKYRIGLTYKGELVGVLMVGRPIARHNDDGYTLEVVRCCVLEGHMNACSKLYAASWRIARDLGYKRMITYTLIEEQGISLKAVGWKDVAITEARPNGWNSKNRPRKMADKYPTGQKVRWEVTK